MKNFVFKALTFDRTNEEQHALPSTAEYDSWTSTIWGGPAGPTSRRGVLG